MHRYAAVVSDLEELGATVPGFGLEDIDALAEFILDNRKRFPQYEEADSRNASLFPG